MFTWFSREKKTASRGRSGERKLYIPESIYRRMIGHCLEEKPLEACGLLVGAGDLVSGGYAADNEHRSPVIYKVDDHQLLQVLRESRLGKHELIGIYHSHVKTEAVPSRTDIEQATWPEAYYVIVSLAGSAPAARAWRIVDRQVTEHKLVVQSWIDGAWRDLRRAVQGRREGEPEGK